MERSKLKKTGLNLGKILISIILLYFVFTKIPLREIAKLWETIDILYLFIGALLFLCSQFISAKRLALYFNSSGFALNYKSNLKLYFLGMFYNFFIPGGIGGDAYKVYILNKKFNWNAKRLTAALFCDRLSGLISIGLIVCLLSVVLTPQWYWVFLLMMPIGMLAAYLLISNFFSNFKKIFCLSLAWSLLVQVFQILSFTFLLISVGVDSDFVKYAVMFLLSSVLSLVSFAGIGIREMLFFQISKYYQFSPTYSVAASLLFTFITAFFSLFGMYFQLRTLNLTVDKQ